MVRKSLILKEAAVADMKYVIVGASGMIGKAFMSELSKSGIANFGTYHSRPKAGLLHLDITDKESAVRLLSKLEPDVVVQTAAQPNVDYCEDHQDEAWRTNVLGTENLASACRQVGAKHLFISTDYVFDGTAGPYGEEDSVNPINYYARTKVEGENRVRSLSDHLIIRTGVVFDADRESKNFALRLVNELSAGRSLRVPIDQIGNPTLASNLAACSIELGTRNKVGTYHLAGRSLMSRYDFALMICGVFDLDQKLVYPVTSEELQQKAKRPKKLGLKTDKASRELSTQLLDAATVVTLFKEKLSHLPRS